MERTSEMKRVGREIEEVLPCRTNCHIRTRGSHEEVRRIRSRMEPGKKDKQRNGTSKIEPMEQKPIKILYQPLKAKWYRMIEAGIKNEEYREPTVYWVRRLFHCDMYFDWCKESKWCFGCSSLNELASMKKNTDYTHVQFSLSYPKKGDESRRMTFELKGIEYREGREEWGAEKGKKYLVEVLGRRTTLDGEKLWEE